MLSAGDRLGAYELVEPLGSGGFGTVWLAKAQDGGRDVAIKVLHPNLIEFRATPKGPSVAERFLAEARIIQKLDYPGFVRIFDFIEAPKRQVIAYVMERLRGRDLTKTLQSVTLPTLLEVIAQTAETLGFLHSHGIIHRDVKGSNIFICDPDRPGGMHRVKLIDFGIAKELHAEAMLESTATGYFLGTVRTMAPECFGRWSDDPSALTGAVDQWSLGVTLYYFLTGRMPFEEDSLVRVITQIESGEPPAIRMMRRYGYADTPQELVGVVRRCMAKDPAHRYVTMDRLAAELRRIAANILPPASDPTVFDPMLARTVPDSRTPEGAHLAEAHQLARSMRETQADPYAATKKTKSVSPEAIATQLDHPKVDAAAELHARADTLPSEPATVGNQPAAAISGVMTGITKHPKLLEGPLIIDSGELKTAVISKRDSQAAAAELASEDTLVRGLEAEDGTAATLLRMSVPPGPTENATIPPAPTSGQATQPLVPATLPPSTEPPSGSSAPTAPAAPAAPAAAAAALVSARAPTVKASLQTRDHPYRSAVLVVLIVIAMALAIYLALHFRA